jgi:hypothetical protein
MRREENLATENILTAPSSEPVTRKFPHVEIFNALISLICSSTTESICPCLT